MKMNLYAITWVDCYFSDPEWYKIITVECSTPAIHTVGFLLEKTKKYVALACNFCPDNCTVTGITTIPRGCIKKIKKLRKVKF